MDAILSLPLDPDLRNHLQLTALQFGCEGSRIWRVGFGGLGWSLGSRIDGLGLRSATLWSTASMIRGFVVVPTRQAEDLGFMV